MPFSVVKATDLIKLERELNTVEIEAINNDCEIIDMQYQFTNGQHVVIVYYG